MFALFKKGVEKFRKRNMLIYLALVINMAGELIKEAKFTKEVSISSERSFDKGEAEEAKVAKGTISKGE